MPANKLIDKTPYFYRFLEGCNSLELQNVRIDAKDLEAAPGDIAILKIRPENSSLNKSVGAHEFR